MEGYSKQSFLIIMLSWRKKQNVIFRLKARTAGVKRQADFLLTNLLLSPLLFVLVFLFVFFPVLVWAAIAVLQLLFVFVSVLLLRVVLMFAATQQPQGSEVKCNRSDVVQMHGHKRCHWQKTPAITTFKKQWQCRGQLPIRMAKVVTLQTSCSPQVF